MDDLIRELGWGNHLELPVANVDNKLLEEIIVKKVNDRSKFSKDLTENSSKASALRDHIKNVKDELASTQSLLEARKKELTTEEHLKAIGEREKGRLDQENQRLYKELDSFKESRNILEVLLLI